MIKISNIFTRRPHCNAATMVIQLFLLLCISVGSMAEEQNRVERINLLLERVEMAASEYPEIGPYVEPLNAFAQKPAPESRQRLMRELVTLLDQDEWTELDQEMARLIATLAFMVENDLDPLRQLMKRESGLPSILMRFAYDGFGNEELAEVICGSLLADLERKRITYYETGSSSISMQPLALAAIAKCPPTEITDRFLLNYPFELHAAPMAYFLNRGGIRARPDNADERVEYFAHYYHYVIRDGHLEAPFREALAELGLKPEQLPRPLEVN